MAHPRKVELLTTPTTSISPPESLVSEGFPVAADSERDITSSLSDILGVTIDKRKNSGDKSLEISANAEKSCKS